MPSGHDAVLCSARMPARAQRSPARWRRVHAAKPCVFGEDVRQMRQSAAASTRLVEDVVCEKNRSHEIHFCLISRLPRRRCKTYGLAHVFQTSSLKCNDFALSVSSLAGGSSRTLGRKAAQTGRWARARDAVAGGAAQWQARWARDRQPRGARPRSATRRHRPNGRGATSLPRLRDL